MKGLIIKLGMAASGIALLAGVTYGAFSSNSATITGVTLGSATPTLQVWNGTSWQNSADGPTLGISETGMYPGWVGIVHTFSLKNTSTDTAFGQIIATLPSATGDASWDNLKNVVLMNFSDGGTNSGWYTLNQWLTGGANILASPLAFGAQKDFGVQFKMDSGATDTAKGQTITGMVLSFVGQTP